MAQPAKYNLEYFKNIIKLKGGKLLSTQYRILNDILKIQCEKGHIWEVEAHSIHRGHWCWDCFCLSQRIPFDEDFFSRDNEESFYVAGFMAADGWKCRSNDSYANGIQLSVDDEDHLLLIQKLIKHQGKLSYTTKKPVMLPGNRIGKISKMCTLLFSSSKTFKDLERFNVVERKTYIYHMPEWLIDHPLIHHFMRGYIDGDGCFCFKNNKNQRLPQVLFTMKGTAIFLQQFHNIIFKNEITPNDRIILAKNGKKYAAFNTLQYGGNIIVSKLYDFLYKDATIFLNRKKEIAQMASEYRMNGTDKKRQVESKKGITKELLLEKATELKSYDEIAKFFNCTIANISYMTESYGIRDEIRSIINNHPTAEEILKYKKELGSFKKVQEKYNLSKYIIREIVKKAS